MDKIILNDGTELYDSYTATDDVNLFLYIRNGMNIAQIATLLNDPERTRSITYQSVDKMITYTDFIYLRSISNGVNGLVSVVMHK